MNNGMRSWGAISLALAVLPALAAAPADTAPGSQGQEDYGAILDHIREVEARRLRQDLETERLQAKRAELQAELDRLKSERARLQAAVDALTAQSAERKKKARVLAPGWFIALDAVSLSPAKGGPPLTLPAGRVVKVTAVDPDGVLHCDVKGVEFLAKASGWGTEAEVMDSISRRRAEAARTDDRESLRRLGETENDIRARFVAAREPETKKLP